MKINSLGIKSSKNSHSTLNNQEEKSHQPPTSLLLDNPKNYTSPSYPLSEQAKDKLTTSTYYRAIFSKGTLFSTPVNNISMDNLKYIINSAVEDNLIRVYGKGC